MTALILVINFLAFRDDGLVCYTTWFQEINLRWLFLQ